MQNARFCCLDPSGSRRLPLGSHSFCEGSPRQNVRFCKMAPAGSHWLPLRLPLFFQEALRGTSCFGLHPAFYLYY